MKQTTLKGKGKKIMKEEISNVDSVVVVTPEVTHLAAKFVPKATKAVGENIPVDPQINLDLTPLVDTYFKITDCHCEFDFYELHL